MKYSEVIAILKLSKSVNGWFTKEAALLIAILDDVQKQNSIHGNIFEIGVHHGKSTLFFTSLLNEDEKINVCDIFDSQDDNKSLSGLGDEQVFLKNVELFGSKSVTKIYTCISSELDAISIGKNYRIFHIDGGHLMEEAYSDLLLASKVLCEGGIIIVDDPFQSKWPGVTEAIIKFLNENKKFYALVIGFNKLVIVQKTYQNIYTSHLNNKSLINNYKLGFPLAYKQLPFVDSPIGIFYLPHNIKIKSIKTKTQVFLLSNPRLRSTVLRSLKFLGLKK